MKVVILKQGNTEALTLAALEFAAERVSFAAHMADLIGTADAGLKTISGVRRKFGANAIREAQTQLNAALALMELGT